jgi:hypothetical protein
VTPTGAVPLPFVARRTEAGRAVDAVVGLRTADARTALVVVPGADHGLRVRSAGSERRFAPGVWDLIGSWLRTVT